MLKNLLQLNNTPVSAVGEKTLQVEISRCPQSHPCPSVKVCPVGALTQSGFNAPEVNSDTCIKCRKCVNFCPMHALMFQ